MASGISDALCALPSEKALDTLALIEKLTQNIVSNPAEEKFRFIKLSNPKIAAAITNVPSAVNAMKQMGWVDAPDGLTLPQSVLFVHEKEISAINQAKEYFNKEADSFEYTDLDAKVVRLVKHRNDSPPHIEVFLDGVSHWKGYPTFGSSTGVLACAGKGVSSVPEAFRDRLRKFLAAMPPPEANSTADVENVAEGVFEYTDSDGERVRLVKHLAGSLACIEVFVEGASFWKGIPEFSQSTGLLTCGNKGASSVPEAFRQRLQQYLAAVPAPAAPVLSLDLSGQSA